MRAELEELQQGAVAERAEKEEMCRLHNELLKQLKTAEEEKEELQVGHEGGAPLITLALLPPFLCTPL